MKDTLLSFDSGMQNGTYTTVLSEFDTNQQHVQSVMAIVWGSYALVALFIVILAMCSDAKVCLCTKFRHIGEVKLKHQQILCIPILCRLGIKNGSECEINVRLDV